MGDEPREDPDRLPRASRRLQHIRRTTAARARPLAVLASAALLVLALHFRGKLQEGPQSTHSSRVSVAETGTAAQDALQSAASASTESSNVEAAQLDSGVAVARKDQQSRGAEALLADQEIANHAASVAQQGLLSTLADGATGLPQQDVVATELHRTLVGATAAGEGGAAAVGTGAVAAAAGNDAAGAAAAGSGSRSPVFLFAGVLSGRGYRHRRLAVREAWADGAQARISARDLESLCRAAARLSGVRNSRMLQHCISLQHS